MVSSGRPVVPRISPGTPVTQAQQILRNSDLTPRQDPNEVHSHPTAPPGTVVATSPAAGTELNVGAPVTLVLSTGPRHSRSDDEDDEDDGNDNLRRSIVDRIEDGLRRALGGG
jgi:serine/threonine-protein kinase